MELEGGHRFSEGKRIIGGLRYPFKSRGLSTGVKVRMLMGTLDSSVPYISKQLVLNNKKTKKNKVIKKKYFKYDARSKAHKVNKKYDTEENCGNGKKLLTI